MGVALFVCRPLQRPARHLPKFLLNGVKPLRHISLGHCLHLLHRPCLLRHLTVPARILHHFQRVLHLRNPVYQCLPPRADARISLCDKLHIHPSFQNGHSGLLYAADHPQAVDFFSRFSIKHCSAVVELFPVFTRLAFLKNRLREPSPSAIIIGAKSPLRTFFAQSAPKNLNERRKIRSPGFSDRENKMKLGIEGDSPDSISQ